MTGHSVGGLRYSTEQGKGELKAGSRKHATCTMSIRYYMLHCPVQGVGGHGSIPFYIVEVLLQRVYQPTLECRVHHRHIVCTAITASTKRTTTTAVTGPISLNSVPELCKLCSYGVWEDPHGRWRLSVHSATTEAQHTGTSVPLFHRSTGWENAKTAALTESLLESKDRAVVRDAGEPVVAAVLQKTRTPLTFVCLHKPQT